MRALKQSLFLFLAALLSVASTSFAFSSNNLDFKVSNSSQQLSASGQDQTEQYFVSGNEWQNSLLDVVIDFEEEEDEGKKKLSTFSVGILTSSSAQVVYDNYQKRWVAQRNQCLHKQSIRLHLLVGKIQI